MIWSWSDYLDCYNLDSKKFIIASCTPTSVVYRNFFKTGYFSNDLIDLAIAARKRDKNKFSKIIGTELFKGIKTQLFKGIKTQKGYAKYFYLADDKCILDIE